MATPRKVTKAAEKLEKHSAEMQKVAKEWQAAAGKDKQKLLDQLKKMTHEKRDLESQLQRAIADLDKDTELQIDEVRRLIRSIIREEIKKRKK
jgi:flagellar hook-associated protein FlgK